MTRIGTTILFALSVLFSACAYDGEATGADFYLENDSSQTVVLEWTGFGEPVLTDPIAPGAMQLFHSDSDWGSTGPTPNSSLSSVRLLDEGGVELYRQDPIDNSQWTAAGSSWTLVVTDEMLTVP